MSLPQPFTRRRPMLLGLMSVLALVNLVVNVLGLLHGYATPIRWVFAGLWLAVLAVCFLAWRRQVRRFDERTAAMVRDSQDGSGPVGPRT